MPDVPPPCYATADLQSTNALERTQAVSSIDQERYLNEMYIQKGLSTTPAMTLCIKSLCVA